MAHDADDPMNSKPDLWQAQHAAGRLVGQIGRAVSVAAGAVESWCRQAALERELQRLSDGDLQDIGISRDQITEIARSQEAPQLLEQMLQRLAIADTVLARHPGLREELLRACRSCSARKLCRHWLRRDSTDDDYRHFCPNETQLAALRRNP